MSLQSVNTDGTLSKAVIAVCVGVTISTITGAFGLAMYVSNRISSLEVHVDDGFGVINARLDSDDRKLDDLRDRVDERRGPQ